MFNLSNLAALINKIEKPYLAEYVIFTSTANPLLTGEKLSIYLLKSRLFIKRRQEIGRIEYDEKKDQVTLLFFSTVLKNNFMQSHSDICQTQCGAPIIVLPLDLHS